MTSQFQEEKASFVAQHLHAQIIVCTDDRIDTVNGKSVLYLIPDQQKVTIRLSETMPLAEKTVVNLQVGQYSHVTFIREIVGNNHESIDWSIDIVCHAHSVVRVESIVRGDVAIQDCYVIRHSGKAAQSDSRLVYWGGKSFKARVYTEQKHEASDTVSTLGLKNVLDDQARSIHNGMVFIDKSAYNADAHQENRTLLLSEDAVAHATPSLEVLTNDVSCAHGTTISSLQEHELLYAATRGIPAQRATQFFVSQFVSSSVPSLASSLLQ